MKNFRDFFFQACNKYKGSYAFRYDCDGSSELITYQMFYSDLVNTANTLFGVCRQKNVVLLGRNSYDYILTIAACLCGAGKLFLVDGDSSEESLETFFQETKVDILLYDCIYEETAKKLEQRFKLSKVYNIEGCRGNDTDCHEFSFPDYSFDEMRVVFSTSGTVQGNKKKVMLSGRTVLNNMLAVNKESLHEISQEQHIQLLILPLFHTLAFSCALLHAIYVGDMTYISFQPNNIEKELLLVHPHYVFVVPSVLEYLYRRYKEKAAKKTISGLKEYFGENLFCLLCGGAKINPKSVEGYANIGIRVIRGYGMSEAGPVIAVTNSRTGSDDWENLGNPVCHEVRIFNNEICIRGENLMLGYYLAPKLTKDSYEEGWFHTGDAGFISENGLLYITGRIKNVIVLSSGKKIIPEEVEEQIANIKGITGCGILSLDEKSINICIYCENMEKQRDYILSEIDLWNHKQPLYKRIRDIVIGDIPLPQTATNKIIRTELPVHVKLMKTVNSLRSILMEHLYYNKFIGSKEVLSESIGFDSFEMISLASAIEEKFECSIDIEELLKQRTLLELGIYIEGLVKKGK